MRHMGEGGPTIAIYLSWCRRLAVAAAALSLWSPWVGCGGRMVQEPAADAGSGGASAGGAHASGGDGAGGAVASGGNGAGGAVASGGAQAATGGMGAMTGGSGGLGGSGGSGGHGSGGAAGFTLPSCLRQLFTSCGTDGTCASAADTDGGSLDRFCYASGAHAEFTQQATCTDVGRSEVRVRKSDGSPCFTFVVANVLPGQGCENGTYTWTNAAGEVVATGSLSGGAGPRVAIMCSGNGESVLCSQTGSTACPTGVLSWGDTSTLFSTMTCPAGTCQ